jgi:hypothetical protein
LAEEKGEGRESAVKERERERARARRVRELY